MHLGSQKLLKHLKKHFSQSLILLNGKAFLLKRKHTGSIPAINYKRKDFFGLITKKSVMPPRKEGGCVKTPKVEIHRYRLARKG